MTAGSTRVVVDTSLVLALLLAEPRSAAVERTLRRARRPALSAVVHLEVHDALGRLVRGGRLAVDDARRARDAFAETIADGVWRVIAIERAHVAAATAWLADPTLALHSLDALQVAVAHALRETLVTGDRAQATAARRLGVRVRLM